ncbi:50S ribosomal protein L3 [Candidatus Peregrinibacteria bacterium]|nr:50S ribosomal protein L3 [Candidatus Peregrinibacteria bacterium]
MSGILGKKIGMTRLIQDDGRVIPLTVIECQPNTVVQIKTVEKDGYPALVLGFDALKKPTKNRKYRYVREFSITAADASSFKVGDSVNVDMFGDADAVQITSISKGKGFQGVMKRHNFAGGPRTHGSHAHREPGSIGARARPGHVHKGKRMAGRMGSDRKTIDATVVYKDLEKNLLGLKGPVSGAKNTLIIIRKK